jgi:farnesyl-diphosphate farnesyltransferase
VPESELTPIANSFGKSLQLVNILRDLPADLAAGRCYLPADELAAVGAKPEDLLRDPGSAQPVVDHWISRARGLLDQGRVYINAVRTRRARMACYLPWRLAGLTLDLLQREGPLQTQTKLKVPRSAVRSALWRGLWLSLRRDALA